MSADQVGPLDEAKAQLTEALSLFQDSHQPLWADVTHFRPDTAPRPRFIRPRTGPRRTPRTPSRPSHCAASAAEWRRATLLVVLGKALHAMGHADPARACWRKALAVFEAIEAPSRSPFASS